MNKYILLLTFLLVYTFFSCKNAQHAIKSNEFGLKVTTKIQQLKSQIKSDSLLQLVNLKNYIPNVKFDFRYADTQNFTHQKLYKKPAAFLRIDAAKKLQNAAFELEKIGLGFIIFDAYRPYSVTKKMWQIVPNEDYAANPAKGSGHNRGAAIDLTLYNLQTGEVLTMPTPFDEFSEKAHHNYDQLDEYILKNREILKTVMTNNGFVALNTEWWHYSLPNAAKNYNLLDIDFRKLKRIKPKK